VTKPRLAYVSPLPPVRSGIADHSGELLPDLARYYRIELIVDQPEVSDLRLTANFPVRTTAWFEENGGLYDRILYQFGNSEHHRHMFKLIERHPGSSFCMISTWAAYSTGWVRPATRPGSCKRSSTVPMAAVPLSSWRNGRSGRRREVSL